MAENSAIEWTNHTKNLVWGCIKKSPGCIHCYAERESARYGFDVWGPGKQRRVFGDGYWNEVLKWNDRAQKTGVRERVFCSSMCDVFEDHPVNNYERENRLWPLVTKTPYLDWLLLTKEPWNIARLMPANWLAEPQPNVWLMFSAENQEWFDKRWVYMRWFAELGYITGVSAEPLIGSITLPDDFLALGKRGWVIVGGESGPGARPMHPDWARGLRDQCVNAGVAYFMKQWGEFIPGSQLANLPQEVKDKIYPYGGNPQWMARGGSFDPEYHPPSGYIPNAWRDGHDLMVKIGKKYAGRLLDGREWSEFPEVTYGKEKADAR